MLSTRPQHSLADRGCRVSWRVLTVAILILAIADQAAWGQPTVAPAQAPAADRKAEAELEHPFSRRLDIPDFPKDTQWLNVGGPLRKKDLKGKFVLLDFWTYCCINCIHVLPELKKLEAAYPNQLVVIGVHSAKFEGEKITKNIEEAILRYEIAHPVINDADHKIWNMFGISSWPTLLLIDPEGNAVWGKGGETEFETVDRILKDAIPYYRQKGVLDESPIRFDLLAHRADKNTALRFPGKILADQSGKRLFISDSNHNRIVVTSLSGDLIDVIGSGAIGSDDGGYAKASFDHPQGVVLHRDTLYVADTENHLIRKVDLSKKTVSTIAGVGRQSRGPWPGLENVTVQSEIPDRFVGPPKTTALNSPWALHIHGADMYIAMAGPHQIWKMPLDESEIGPYAGNGREDIVDGPLLPPIPYREGFSSFAQPSGLTSDGKWLYVADSEGSSIRAVPFDPDEDVRTIVGTSDLPFARLFTFGDRNGAGLLRLLKDSDGNPILGAGFGIKTEGPLLQHALGVVHDEGVIYVADTYNNKIKSIDATTGETTTIAGTGEPGSSDSPTVRFDEPAGITIADGKLYVADTNNHAIRTIELKTGDVATLKIAGLKPPALPSGEKPSFPAAKSVQVARSTLKPIEGEITLSCQINLPIGWKINTGAPMRVYVESLSDDPIVPAESLGWQTIASPGDRFDIKLPVTGDGSAKLRISMDYYYCQDGGEGLCKVGSVAWTAPLEISRDGKKSNVAMQTDVD